MSSPPRIRDVEAGLAQAWPLAAWQDVSVVLAVSGGSDSVALARAMHHLKQGGEGRLAIAHFNHGLRGRESDEDERFVAALASELAIPCEVGRSLRNGIQQGRGLGLEAAARQARYEFLEAVAAQRGARYVATAHTADDQAETILHRIVRGTGMTGLAGISRVRRLGPAATLVRPLLGLRRAELRGYLTHLGQSYRVDATNADVRRTRNRIRHELLPELTRKYNPCVVEALVRLGRLAAEAQDVVGELVEDLASRCMVESSEGMTRIALEPLGGQSPYVVRELLMACWRRQQWPLRGMGLAEWDVLAEAVLAGPSNARAGKRMLPGGIAIERREAELVLRRTAARETEVT